MILSFTMTIFPIPFLLNAGEAVLLDAEDLTQLDAGEPVLLDAEELVLLDAGEAVLLDSDLVNCMSIQARTRNRSHLLK